MERARSRYETSGSIYMERLTHLVGVLVAALEMLFLLCGTTELHIAGRTPLRCALHKRQEGGAQMEIHLTNNDTVVIHQYFRYDDSRDGVFIQTQKFSESQLMQGTPVIAVEIISKWEHLHRFAHATRW